MNLQQRHWVQTGGVKPTREGGYAENLKIGEQGGEHAMAQEIQCAGHTLVDHPFMNDDEGNSEGGRAGMAQQRWGEGVCVDAAAQWVRVACNPRRAYIWASIPWSMYGQQINGLQ